MNSLRTEAPAPVRRASAIALCIAFLATASAFASPIFGPKTFTSVTSKRQVFDEAFTATAELCATPAYTLVVTQGTPAVTSGSISLNGVEIVGDNDFKSIVSTIQVLLDPRDGANALHIEVDGKPGSSISVAVTRELDQPAGVAKRYAVSNGRLTTTDTLTGDAGTTYAVIVRNGDSSGHRVNSGSVRIGDVTFDLSSATVVLRRHIAIQGTSNISVDLRGEAGSFVTVQLVRVLEQCGPQVKIETPEEGASITTTPIVVSGTLVSALGAGVVVNDNFPADVDWSHAGTSADPFHWTAWVEGTAGPVTLTAVATDPSSATASATRHVNFDPVANSVGLRATPSSGVPPVDVTYTIASTVDANAARYDLDLDGDGVFERTYTSFPPAEDLVTRFTTAGVRTVSLRVLSKDGQVFTATTQVNIQPMAVMDALLRQQWNRFTTALAAGDIEGALAVTDANARERYRPYLQLIRSRLSVYAAGITTIYPVWISGNAAHYLMVRDENGRKAGYHVYFVRDAGGVWRIDQF